MNLNTVAEVKRPALADTTAVRFPHLPFTPDRIFSKLAEQP
jgi:putative selenate reductase molybdopterin-binding subunit